MHWQVIPVLTLWWVGMHIVRVGLIMTLHLLHFPHLPHHTSLQNGEDTGDSCLTGPTAFCTSDFSASWLSPTLSVAPLNLLCSCLLLSTSPHKGVQAQTLKFFFSPRRLIHSHHLNTIKRLKRSQCMSPASHLQMQLPVWLLRFTLSNSEHLPLASNQTLPKCSSLWLALRAQSTQLHPTNQHAYNKPILPILSTVTVDV